MPTPGWLRREDLPLDASNRRYIDPPNLDQILDQWVNWRGDVNAGGYKLLNFSFAAAGNVEVGGGQTGNRQAYIDLIGDDTYSDYGLRLIRNNTGPDASSELLHRGTGELRFTTQEASPITFYQGGTRSLTISSTGLTFPDGTVQGSAGVPTSRQIIAGAGLTGGGDLSANRTLSVVDNTSIQKVYAAINGSLTATPTARRLLNFIAGANVVISGADNTGGDRIDITINSTGGSGGGGSQTPWLSDIDGNGYALNNARGVSIISANEWPKLGVHNTKNDGGAINTVEILDDRGFSGNNSGASLYMRSWAGGGSTGKLFSLNTTLGSGDIPVLVGTLAGNVGIGTASPTDLLTVSADLNTFIRVESRSTSAAGAIIKYKRNTTGAAREYWAGIGIMGTDEWGVYDVTGVAMRLHITSSGNVGIGTASPTARLHSVYPLLIDPSVTYNAPASWNLQTEQLQLAGGAYNSAPYAYWLQVRHSSNAAAPMVLNPLGGNIGIGTSSPNARLDVLYPATDPGSATGGAATAFSIRTAQSVNANGLFMGIDETITPYGWIQAVQPGVAVRSLVLNPVAGNVGIGSTAATPPAAPLEIYKVNTSGVGPELLLRNHGSGPAEQARISFYSGGSARGSLHWSLDVDSGYGGMLDIKFGQTTDINALTSVAKFRSSEIVFSPNAGDGTVKIGAYLHCLGGLQGGQIYVGYDTTAQTRFGAMMWIPDLGLGFSCGGNIALIVTTTGQIKLQIGTTPTTPGSGLLYKDASGFVKMG